MEIKAMEIFPLTLNRLGLLKRVAFFLIAFLLLAFVVYIQWFASEVERGIIGGRNLDKIPHILAGIFIAIAYEWAAPHRTLRGLLIAFFIISVGWEAYEYFFNPDVIYFAHISPDLWRLDTLGDITAGLLGAYGYWVFLMDRRDEQNAPA